jgi:hypothetical protein
MECANCNSTGMVCLTCDNALDDCECDDESSDVDRCEECNGEGWIEDEGDES